MQKLILPPDQASYSVSSADEVLRVQLDGGRGRYRRDILNASRMVNCQWTIGPENFQYLNVFYRYSVENASEPFLIDLYLDDPFLTEHQANFIPGSFSLSSQQGLTFVVTAQIEVKPSNYDPDYSSSYLMLIAEYGSVEAATEILNLLEKLVNVDLAGIDS
jgi:hypothetical protein